MGLGVQLEFFAVNFGPNHAAATLYLYGDQGDPLLWVEDFETVDGIEYSIPSGGSFQAIVEGPPDTLRWGYGILVLDGNESLLSSSLVYHLEPYELSVGASPEGVSFHLFAQRTEQARTGLALANYGTGDLRIQAHLRDGDGTLLESTEIFLAAGHHIARFVEEILPDAPDEFTGSIHLYPNGDSLRVLGLRQRSDGSLSTLPGASGAVPQQQ
jgi:hypothetical protein